MHEKPEPLLLCASEGFELTKTMGRSDRGSKIRREGKDKDSRKNRTESMLQESLKAKWEGHSSPQRRRNPIMASLWETVQESREVNAENTRKAIYV